MKALFSDRGELNTGKPAIIAFGWNTWSDYWMARQQYLFRLGARGWPVVYTAGNLYIWDLMATIRSRAAPLISGFEKTSNVTVYQPGVMCPRWPSRRLYDRFAIWNEVRQIKEAVDAEHRQVLVFITHPKFAPYLDHFDGVPIVYFAEDAFSLMPSWTEQTNRMQERLVKRADLIVTCATSVAKQLPGDGPSKARILHNGVDYAAFNVPDAVRCPDDLAAVPEPRIGYTGTINLKVNFNLIATIARRRPDWNWVLVGPVGIGRDESFESNRDAAHSIAVCRELPNVHFLGCKPFFDLPLYMANMDVNTMCYRTDGSGWWKAIDPLKTNEYLAVGKPVVSADLVNVRPFSDCIDIVRTEEEWMAAIEKALGEDYSDRLALGRARAKHNDWNIMTDDLESWLLDLASTSQSSASSSRDF